VNNKSLLLTLSALLPLQPLLSDFEDDIYSQEKIEKPSTFFRAVGECDFVRNTHINKKGFDDDTVKFYSVGAEAEIVALYSKENREAFLIAGGYSHQKIDWVENPYFDQDNFDTASVAFRLYSNRLEDWIWQAQVAINGDIQHFTWSNYINFDLILWGRYSCAENIGFHAGFYMETGMKIDHIYPIIGVDWKINDTWMINAIFPMNISVVYSFDCHWKAALAMRFFDIRHRVGENEPLPMALVSYRNNGGEFFVKYEWDPYIEASVHAGYTFGGKLRIADKQNRHPTHYKLDPAGYVGGELTVRF